MRYAKLEFRNIRRSLRDYIIYFITLTLTAVLMYSFLLFALLSDFGMLRAAKIIWHQKMIIERVVYRMPPIKTN